MTPRLKLWRNDNAVIEQATERLHLAYSRCMDLESLLSAFWDVLLSIAECDFGFVLVLDRGASGEAIPRIEARGLSQAFVAVIRSLFKQPDPAGIDSISPLYDSIKSLFREEMKSMPGGPFPNRLLFIPIFKLDLLEGAVLLGSRRDLHLEDEYGTCLQAMGQELSRLADRIRFAQWCASKKYDLRMIGSSDSLRDVERLVLRCAKSNFPVLVTGETGSGKELIARSIHFHSTRCKGPFVEVNCGVFTSDSLIAAELFGHVKGAFTDAHSSKKGKFELADGGTLFLDEVASMSPAMQVALLRTLRYGEVHKLGDESVGRRVDVRIVAACNEDLREMVRAGTFREDIYSRLTVVQISAPPLRERLEDLPLLVDYFLHRISQAAQRPEKSISAAALNSLTSYNWPDNIAGLENALRFADLVSGHRIEANDLPRHIIAAPVAKTGPSAVEGLAEIEKCRGLSLEDALENFERLYILQALEAHSGNISATSRALEITRQGLQKKMLRLGIRRASENTQNWNASRTSLGGRNANVG